MKPLVTHSSRCVHHASNLSCRSLRYRHASVQTLSVAHKYRGSVVHAQVSTLPKQQQVRQSIDRRKEDTSFAHKSVDAPNGSSLNSSVAAKASAMASVADAEIEEPVLEQLSADLQELKEAEKTEVRAESLAGWVAAAFCFGAGIWFYKGAEQAQEYFAGYLLEQTLSIDNLFVFILVFNYFKTPPQYQSKVLTWGLATAAFLRLVMIELGVELVETFRPLLLVFAAIVLYSSYKLLFMEDDNDEDLSQNYIVKLCQQALPVSKTYDRDNFFTVQNGVTMATPMLLTLIVVELSDVLFAVDSIPAVFGVTLDPFIIYTSNIFAILSLRSLYSFVATAMSQLRYLDKAVALVLGFVGVKLTGDFFHVDIRTDASLGIVASLLCGGVVASLLLPKQEGDGE